MDRIPLETIPAIDEFYVYIAPQTNLDSQPRSVPALELHSRAASSVGITSPFQRSQHRKQFRRKADKKGEGVGLSQTQVNKGSEEKVQFCNTPFISDPFGAFINDVTPNLEIF